MSLNPQIITTVCVHFYLVPEVLTLVFVHMQGFDEYMNLVLDDAEEINVKKNTRKMDFSLEQRAAARVATRNLHSCREFVKFLHVHTKKR